MQGIGLPLEEALSFWRMEFTPKTPAEKFNKEYAYNVRYNYGKEGSRKDYTPYSCLKIISTTPGVVCSQPPCIHFTSMPVHHLCTAAALVAPSIH